MSSNDKRDISSRRTVVTGATTALVTALISDSAEAQSGAAQNGTPQPRQCIRQNPVSEYPHPPFPRQTQNPPGLASKMTPRPDHGESSYQGSGRLIGRKALITGGDSGIGRAAAIAFAREGADVAINYLPVEEPDASEVMGYIRSAGRNGVALPGDIRDEAFCHKLVEDAAGRLGGLDIVVNNAGHQQAQQSILNLTTAQFDSTFKTNVYAMFWITRAALPHLSAGASIINTASVEAYDPSPILLDYAQTKACIVAFTKSLAKQLAKQGIRVNAVAPGPFWTPLQVSGGQPPDKLPDFGAQTPYGRPGQPAELGPLYVFLASQESSYATGQVMGENGAKQA